MPRLSQERTLNPFLTPDEQRLPGSGGPRPVERLSLDEGVSKFKVYAIHQDQQGFMWFGTFGGLNKYDGHSFTVSANGCGCAYRTLVENR